MTSTAAQGPRALVLALAAGTAACLVLAAWGALILNRDGSGAGAALLLIAGAALPPCAFALYAVARRGAGAGAGGEEVCELCGGGRSEDQPLLLPADAARSSSSSSSSDAAGDDADRPDTAAPSAWTEGLLFLYAGHFLTMWGVRLRQFAVPLVLPVKILKRTFPE